MNIAAAGFSFVTIIVLLVASSNGVYAVLAASATLSPASGNYIYLPLVVRNGASVTPEPTDTPTPVDGTWRPFSDDSPWNAPLGDDPSVHPDSDLFIAQMNDHYHATGRSGDLGIGVNVGEWSIPLYYVEEGNRPPEVYVPSTTSWGHDVEAPIPQGAEPDPSSDAHLCIVDIEAEEAWDFWRVQGAYPDLTSGTGRYDTLTDRGVPGDSAPPACREAGFPLIAGLVRPEEIEAGAIRHALVYSFDARDGWDQYWYPATQGADSDNSAAYDVLPLGARLQLKPDVDISDMPRGARIVAQALKDYGMYLGDENDSGSMSLYFQQNGDWSGLFGWADRSALANVTADDFRVIVPPGAEPQPTATQSPQATPQPTDTPSPQPTSTSTSTPTPTPTSMPTSTPTSTSTPTVSPSPTTTSEPTATPNGEANGRILFTHHSTGKRVYAYDHDPLWELYEFETYVDSDCSDGACVALPNWIHQHYPDLEIEEVWWLGEGGNYPSDHQDILVGSACSEARYSNGSAHEEVGTVCDPGDFGDFDAVVLKNCFVNSDISEATMQSYQSAYDALGDAFSAYPDKIFILWNLFPSSSGTTYDRQFSEWMVDDFANQYNNVFVYDVFEYMTCGASNALYAAYDVGDNHPNAEAGRVLVEGGTNACGETVIPFGEFIAQAMGQ